MQELPHLKHQNAKPKTKLALKTIVTTSGLKL
jgi:hypothetical protein